jgi:hypothetical protein
MGRLRVFENRILRSLCGPKRQEVVENGENCIMSVMICTVHRTYLG